LKAILPGDGFLRGDGDTAESTKLVHADVHAVPSRRLKGKHAADGGDDETDDAKGGEAKDNDDGGNDDEKAKGVTKKVKTDEKDDEGSADPTTNTEAGQDTEDAAGGRAQDDLPPANPPPRTDESPCVGAATCAECHEVAKSVADVTQMRSTCAWTSGICSEIVMVSGSGREVDDFDCGGTGGGGAGGAGTGSEMEQQQEVLHNQDGVDAAAASAAKAATSSSSSNNRSSSKFADGDDYYDEYDSGSGIGGILFMMAFFAGMFYYAKTKLLVPGGGLDALARGRFASGGGADGDDDASTLMGLTWATGLTSRSGGGGDGRNAEMVPLSAATDDDEWGWEDGGGGGGDIEQQSRAEHMARVKEEEDLHTALAMSLSDPSNSTGRNAGGSGSGTKTKARSKRGGGRGAAAASRPQRSGSGSGSGSGSSSHLTVSGGLTISISQSEAKSIASDSSARLRSAKKLSLVLDLDHTLLHATADPRAEAYVARSCLLLDDENRRRRREDVRTLVLPMLEGAAPMPMSNVTQINEQIPAPLRHYVKLRPHLARFLTEATERYELTIYTAGTRSYAHKVAHVVSRHIVGARLDEEELNNLRRSLAAAEERARWHEARMKRRRYVEGLNQKFRATATEEEEETQIREDVSVIFDDMEEEEEEEEDVGEGEAKEATDSVAVEEKKGEDEDEKGSDTGETNSANTAANGKGETSPKAVTFDDNKAEGKSNSKSSGGAVGDPIPRKRKRVSFDPAAKDEKKESKDTAKAKEQAASATSKDEAAEAKRVEEENFDQTELEATVKRLRADLGEAERLEKKANELRMKLFGSRIVSRTDVSDLGRDVKSLRRVFPCGGTMAAIIDDREDVWANAENNATGRPGEPPDNLLLIRPYHWKPFSGFADVNNEAGVDVTKAGGEKDNRAESIEDEEQQERQLLWMGDILRRVHERYYAATVSEEKRDRLSVPGILCDLRRNVLGSSPFCRVVLSGLVPLHKQNQMATGATVRPSIVRYAESLGARVMTDVNADTTHVIAARDGTEKTLKARKVPGCAVVRISWLMECWWSITRRELTPHHLIGPPPKAISRPSTTRRRLKSSTVTGSAASEETDNRLLLSGSDSSEDEDFAAELEADLMQS